MKFYTVFLKQCLCLIYINDEIFGLWFKWENEYTHILSDDLMNLIFFLNISTSCVTIIDKIRNLNFFISFPKNDTALEKKIFCDKLIFHYREFFLLRMTTTKMRPNFIQWTEILSYLNRIIISVVNAATLWILFNMSTLYVIIHQ